MKWRRDKTTANPTTSARSGQPSSEDRADGKGRPTPSRKEAEAERKERLKASATGATAKRTRSTGSSARSERNEVRKRIVAGDERALPARDRGPERRYARDLVDQRYNVGEYVLYLAVLAFVSALIKVPALAFASQILIYFVIIAVAVDSFLLRRRVLRAVHAKFPDSDLKGVGRYAMLRAMNIRRLRVPAPQVPRAKLLGRRGGTAA